MFSQKGNELLFSLSSAEMKTPLNARACRNKLIAPLLGGLLACRLVVCALLVELVS